MGLKNNNPNGKIVLASKLNLVKKTLVKPCKKLHLEMNHVSSFLKKILRLPKKQDCS